MIFMSIIKGDLSDRSFVLVQLKIEKEIYSNNYGVFLIAIRRRPGSASGSFSDL